MAKARFDWDPTKDHENQRKHGVAFAVAQIAFADPARHAVRMSRLSFRQMHKGLR